MADQNTSNLVLGVDTATVSVASTVIDTVTSPWSQRAALSVIVCSVVAAAVVFIGKKQLASWFSPYPDVPGPRGIPYIGNAPEIDVNNPAKKLSEWAKDYPKLYQTTALGQKFVWLTSRAATYELFVRRAHNYSSRVELPSTPGSASNPHYLPLMAYGDAWRRHRTFAVSMMASAHKARFYGHPQREAAWLQAALLRDPGNFYDLLTMFCARISARLAYGSPDSAAEHLYNSNVFIRQISLSGPATNRFPFLRPLPEWLVPSKREVRERREREHASFTGLLAQVEHAHSAGELRHSAQTYSSAYLDGKKPGPDGGNKWGFEDDEEAAYAIGMLCTVAIFTISGLLSTLALALARNPEWQTRAQEELDAVLGPERRCAEVADVERLPVLRAIVKECVRWKPMVPLGVPRLTAADDVFEGQKISKGTIVHAVEQVFSRDSTVYTSPDTFDPARWLPPISTATPTLHGHHQFGVGHRTCPGIVLTEIEAMVAGSALLSTFSLSLPTDAHGAPYVPDPPRQSTVIGGPERFAVGLRPRLDDVGMRRVRAVAGLREDAWA